MELRNYQNTALAEIKKHLKNGSKSPLLVLPTGAGKTIVFSELSRYLINRGKKVLILVHRRELVNQACRKLDEINTNYGVIAPTYKSTKDPLQVASVYTLSRRMHKLDYTPDYIIFDEAHHVAAKTWVEVVDKYKKAIRIGVTATPMRLDNKPLGKYFDTLIKGIEIKDLVEQGYLCSHKVYAAPSQIDFSKLKLKRNDYIKKDISKLMKDPIIIGNAVEHYRKYLLNKPTIVFCVDIPHAQIILERFLAAGIKAAVLTGDTPLIERDQILNNLRDNIINVVVSIDVISEGTDLPCVEGAILLRPTNSESLYRQQVGRILRPAEGKQAIVLDHVNNTITHGFIDEHRDWQLTEKDDEIEGKKLPNPSIRICKQCGHIFELQKACPACGFEITKKELIEIEGQLEELRKTRAKLTRYSLVTLKKGFEDSIYSDKEFDRTNKIKLKTEKNIIFKNIILKDLKIGGWWRTNKSSDLKIGDNLTVYIGQSKPVTGILIGFKDHGFENKYEYDYIIPEISEEYKEAGWESYWFPEYIQPGMKVSEIPDYINLRQYVDNKKLKEELGDGLNGFWWDDFIKYVTKYRDEIHMRRRDSTSPLDLTYFSLVFDAGFGRGMYTYIQGGKEKKYFARQDLGEEKDRIKIDLGKKHNGYTPVVLTPKGIQITSGHQKYNEKKREMILKMKGNKEFLLDQFIRIAKQNKLQSGHSIDWVYQNVYAKQLIKDMKRWKR